MRLTLKCEHGERTLEIDEGNEGVGSNHYARERIAVLMPRCPYCEGAFTPMYFAPGEPCCSGGEYQGHASTCPTLTSWAPTTVAGGRT